MKLYLECPICNSKGPFEIDSLCVVEYHPDGVKNVDKVQWDDESLVKCMSCQHAADLVTFKLDP